MKKTILTSLLALSGSSSAITIPPSEVHYPGASETVPFTAIPPYVVNIQGVNKTIDLYGYQRSFNYGGAVPFVNPVTGASDPFALQSWSSTGLADLYDDEITNSGVQGRIAKRVLGDVNTTMIKYKSWDYQVYGACRSQLLSYPIPPRTHVRWRLNLSFGTADGVNNWVLTPSSTWADDGSGNWYINNGGSPVVFWAMTSFSQSNGPMGLEVDTDDRDPTKLMISVNQRTGSASGMTTLVTVHGIQRHTFIPIDIEAFLDERDTSNGGKGALKVTINNIVVLEKLGPTLARGTNVHDWAIDTYLWNETDPYQYNRAIFFKAAKFFVYP